MTPWSLMGCGGSGSFSIAATTTPTPTATATPTPTPTPTPTATGDPLPTPTPTVPSNTASVTGKFLYENNGFVSDIAGNRSQDRVPKPVRFADVVALDATTNAEIQLAPAATNNQGNFALSVPANRAFKIGVVSSTKNSPSFVNLEVRNPLDDSLYIVDFNNPTTSQPFTLGPGATLTLSDLTVRLTPFTSRPASAFNIIDAALVSSEFLRTRRGNPLPLCTYYWSPTSTKGSNFDINGGPNGGPAIFILGGDFTADNTDDQDDDVIRHEYGHYTMSQLGRDVSLGGSHGLFDVINAQTAFSEGMATFLSALSTGLPLAIDTAAIEGTQLGFILNLENRANSFPNTNIPTTRSQFVETTVAEVMWDLVDGVEGRTDSDGDNRNLTGIQILNALNTLKGTTTYTTFTDLLSLIVTAQLVTSGQMTTLLSTTPVNQNITVPPTGANISPIVALPGPTGNTTICVTRTEGEASNTAVAESIVFYTFTVAQTSTVEFRMELAAPGTAATGTDVDMIISNVDNGDALNQAGGFLTTAPRPEGGIETTGPQVLDPGTYIIWIFGRKTTPAGLLANASSQRVPVTLKVLVTP